VSYLHRPCTWSRAALTLASLTLLLFLKFKRRTHARLPQSYSSIFLLFLKLKRYRRNHAREGGGAIVEAASALVLDDHFRLEFKGKRRSPDQLDQVQRVHLTPAAQIAAAVRVSASGVSARSFGISALTNLSANPVLKAEIVLNAAMLAGLAHFHRTNEVRLQQLEKTPASTGRSNVFSVAFHCFSQGLESSSTVGGLL
jgi:hypothetical protein